MIVIVSHPGDSHATEVARILERQGARVLLIDTGRYPSDMHINIQHGENGRSGVDVNMSDGRCWDLTDARAVWWRRPRPIALHPELDNEEGREFAFGECHAGLRGLWSCLDAHWVNDPEKDEVAGRKAFQLKVASRVGLRIPRTLMTNSPDRAREFVRQEGPAGTIYKAFLATESSWRETRRLKLDELDLIDAVQFAPVIFQEYIRANVDLRITVIGNEIFPIEVRSETSAYAFDYRMNLGQAVFRPHTLPASVEGSLRELMRELGLVYGAIDMRWTPEGEYVFLEVNPSGQWQFVAERAGVPISDAMARYLFQATKN